MSKKHKPQPSPDQLALLEAPTASVELEGHRIREAARTARIRSQWRVRQTRCRANKRLRERVEKAKALGLAMTAEELAKIESRRNLGDERFTLWLDAQQLVWGIIALGGPLAAQVFESVEPGYFLAPLDVVFDAARAIHRRGHLVTRQGLLAELKARKVVLLHDRTLDWFDLIPQAKSFPRHVTAQHVEESLEQLKQA